METLLKVSDVVCGLELLKIIIISVLNIITSLECPIYSCSILLLVHVLQKNFLFHVIVTECACLVFCRIW